MTDLQTRTCQGVKLNGEPCGSNILVGESSYCYSHTPLITPEEKHAARSRGGVNSNTYSRLERRLAENPTLRHILQLQAETTDQVFNQQLPPGVGTSVAALTRAMLSVLELVETAERTAVLGELLTKLQTGDYAIAQLEGYDDE